MRKHTKVFKFSKSGGKGEGLEGNGGEEGQEMGAGLRREGVPGPPAPPSRPRDPRPPDSEKPRPSTRAWCLSSRLKVPSRGRARPSPRLPRGFPRLHLFAGRPARERHEGTAATPPSAHTRRQPGACALRAGAHPPRRTRPGRAASGRGGGERAARSPGRRKRRFPAGPEAAAPAEAAGKRGGSERGRPLGASARARPPPALGTWPRGACGRPEGGCGPSWPRGPRPTAGKRGGRAVEDARRCRTSGPEGRSWARRAPWPPRPGAPTRLAGRATADGGRASRGGGREPGRALGVGAPRRDRGGPPRASAPAQGSAGGEGLSLRRVTLTAGRYQRDPDGRRLPVPRLTCR